MDRQTDGRKDGKAFIGTNGAFKMAFKQENVKWTTGTFKIVIQKGRQTTKHTEDRQTD